MTVEEVEQTTDIGIVIDNNQYDAYLDYYDCFASYDDPFTHILNMYRTYPEVRTGYIEMGRYIILNNLDYAIAPSNSGFREVTDFNAKNKAMADAFRTIYNSYLFDGWIGPFRGCWSSPFYGKGLDYCEYLFRHGRAWENCLATLEVESTFGLGGTCYYGILYGNYSNTLEGYCNLLADNGVSNEPYQQAYFWNEPGCPRYAEGFCRIVNTLKGWKP